jgi:Cys-tRNA(Pro)/Cys-tRNA(Cys) deacylase
MPLKHLHRLFTPILRHPPLMSTGLRQQRGELRIGSRNVSPGAQMKTEAVKILERLGLSHRVQRFAPRTFGTPSASAEEAAEALAVPLASIVKTLVLRGDRTGVMRVCLPGTRRLNLKKLARASSNKHVTLVPVDQLQRLTGYVRGGVSPLAGRTPHLVFCDASIEAQTRIFVNGGIRGLQIELAPDALLRATNATVADLSDEA